MWAFQVWPVFKVINLFLVDPKAKLWTLPHLGETSPKDHSLPFCPCYFLLSPVKSNYHYKLLVVNRKWKLKEIQHCKAEAGSK